MQGIITASPKDGQKTRPLRFDNCVTPAHIDSTPGEVRRLCPHAIAYGSLTEPYYLADDLGLDEGGDQ